MSGTKKIQDEEDCGCFTESRNKKTCPPIQNVTHPLVLEARYYEFTEEEIRALEECDKESFYRRCLPFSAFLATTAYIGVRTGYLSRNPHFGLAPKVMLAIIIGHVLGRISYMKTCDAKIRSLSANSHLGNVMREYHSKKLSAQETRMTKK